MPQLKISFTPVATAVRYQVCYREQGTLASYTCLYVTSSPAVMTSGIECGKTYEGYIITECDELGTLQSAPLTFVSTILDCPPAECVEIEVFGDNGTEERVSFDFQYECNGESFLGSVVNGQSVIICAQEGSVTSSSGAVSAVPTGMACGGPGPLTTEYINSGYGNSVSEACSNAVPGVTLYSDCASIAQTCVIYTDAAGTTPLTGYNYIFIGGATWDIDPVYGTITGYSEIQC